MAGPDAAERIRRDVMVTPFDDRRGPGVLVVHSGRGLTEFVEEVCGRLAHHGFVGYAIDLFDGDRPETIEDAAARKAALDEREALNRLEDAVAFLSGYREVSRDNVAVIGLGFGGELALELADSTPASIGALVVYYGFADIDWAGLEMPFLGHFAELDPEISANSLRAVQRRMLAKERTCEIKLYEGTEPSFFENEDTARYDATAARKSWESTLEFLKWALMERQ